MKNQLQKIGLLLAAILVLTASGKVLANHIPAADLTYVQVSPFTYQVSLRVYKSCAGSGVSQVMLNVNAPGCNAGRTIPFTLTSSSQVNEQNCSTPAPPVCRFVKYLYTATVTFTAAEQTCPDWVFGYTECCRSSVANLVNASAANMYTEATVKIGQNLFNSSPGFSPLEDPVPVSLVGGEVNYSLAGNDPDCDSLSFELVQPLAAPSSTISFQQNSFNGTAGALMINPCPKPPYSNPFNPQPVIPIGTIPQTYSVAYPLPAIAPVAWNLPPTYPSPGGGGLIWEGRYGVELNSVSGQLSFRPVVSFNSSNPADNQYTVEVKINEWRKIAGLATLVGSTRRTLFYTIENIMNSPMNGNLENITVNGHSIASGEIITLRPGMLLNLQLPIGTCNNQSKLTLSSDVTAALPGAQFSPGSGNTPTGSITWTASQICTGVKFFQVKLEDDNCPIKEFRTHTFGVRVSNTAAVTGIPETEKMNEVIAFSAYPNPFGDQLKFRLQVKNAGRSQVLIYNSLGQMVDRLEVKPVGDDQEITWENASKQANGFYIAQLVCNGQPVKAIRFTKVN